MDLEPLKKDIISFLEDFPRAVLNGHLAVSMFLKETKQQELVNARLALTTYLSVFLHKKGRELYAKTAAKRYTKVTGDKIEKVLDLYEEFFIFYFEIYCPAIEELISSSKIGYISLKRDIDPCKPTSVLVFDKEHPEKGKKTKEILISKQDEYRKSRIKTAKKYIDELININGLTAVIGKGSIFQPEQSYFTTLSDVDFAVYVKGYSKNDRRTLKKKLNGFSEKIFQKTGVKLEFLTVGLELIDTLLEEKKYNALIGKLEGVYFYKSSKFEDRLEKLEKETGRINRKTYSEYIKSL